MGLARSSLGQESIECVICVVEGTWKLGSVPLASRCGRFFYDAAICGLSELRIVGCGNTTIDHNGPRTLDAGCVLLASPTR